MSSLKRKIDVMKSPTSLIRFRNAVGVMLALSAIFAVVISSVTFTQDRALGQTGPTTVSFVEAELTVRENDRLQVSLQFDVPAGGTVPTNAQAIALTMGAVGDTALANTDTVQNDYTGAASLGIDFPAIVTAVTATEAGEYTANIIIVLTDDSVAEPVEFFTVTLGTLAEGFVAGDSDTVTITITDFDDNDAATGTVSIDVNNKAGMPVDEDDEGNKVINFIPKVGHVLTADTSRIVDEDQPLTADTTDGVDARDAPSFVYQWIRTNDGSTTEDDADEAIEGATSSTYELTDDDVGDTFTVQVWSSDQYGNGDGNASAAVEDTRTSPATVVVPAGTNGQAFAQPTATAAIAYDLAQPFIIVGALDAGDMRIEPGVELTRDNSIMFNDQNQLIDNDGMLITVDLDNDDPDMDDLQSDGTTAATERTNVDENAVTFTWHRDDGAGGESTPILCDVNNDNTIGDDEECTAETYKLTNDDVAKDITLVATYTTRNAVDANADATPPIEAAAAVMASIPSENIGRVYSPNKATGMPNISGVAQVGSMLTADINNVADQDGDAVVEADITYTWFYGDAADYSAPLGTGTTYDLEPKDVGNTIKVLASFKDGLGDPDMRVSGLTTEITGSPGEISRIEPTIRSVTVSGGDDVTLSVDIYGLQNAKDNGIDAVFAWTLGDDKINDSDGDPETGREIDFTAPSQSGMYTVTASLDGGECQPVVEADRADDCNASINVQVRRPAPPVAEEVPPVNPPGDIPSLIPDSDGNQYEVFTPVEGGTFDGGEGYSINAAPGAVPNGEFIGVRMSDGGAVSNLGMTHQRYTLGGNSYGVHAVDASGASVSSYVLDEAASVCVPLPAALGVRISDLALVAINSDGSLTILAAQVRLDTGTGITMVCGNLSNLPATVAVGAQGAPGIIPTPEPTPEPVLPVTGGTSPASSMALVAMLLGVGVAVSGTFVALGRRRKTVRIK